MPAIAAVAGADVVLLALIAGILIFGAVMLFRPLLVAGLSSIPFAGGWIAQHVDSLLTSMLGFAIATADAAISPLTDLVRRLWIVGDTITRYVTGTLDNVFNRLWALVHADLPHLQQTDIAHADQVAQIAIAHADQVAAAAIAHADAEFVQLERYAGDLVHAAEARADAEFSAGEAFAVQLAQAAIAHADQVGAEAMALGRAEAAAVAGYAESLASSVLGVVTAGLREAETFTERVGVADQDFARAIGRQAIDHADAAVVAAAAAAAAATAAVATRVQEIEDSPCQRYCSPLGDIGALAQGLFDAGLVAILLGLVAQCERDPAGVAEELRAVVVGPVQGVLSTFGFEGAGR